MPVTQDQLDRLVCPVCHERLLLTAEGIDCMGCRRRFPVEDGLPVLLAARAKQL